MTRRILLGELLVEAQVITREALEEVLAVQKRDGRRLGTLLVESGLVTETQVTQILSQQLSIPWVSLYHIDFSRQLLNLVPRELVERYCLVPIFVRRVRGMGETLYVAMDDPSDERARQEVSQYAGLPVRAMIAPPSDIREAIRVYYGARSAPPQPRPAEERTSEAPLGSGSRGPRGSTEVPPEAPLVEVTAASEEAIAEALASLGPEEEEPPTERVPESFVSISCGTETTLVVEPERTPGARPAEVAQPELAAPEPELVAPEPGLVAPEPARMPGARPAEVAQPELAAPEPARAGSDLDEPPPESGVPIPAREVSMPTPKRGVRPKMITLTLLDGTQVTLPARMPKAAAEEQPEPREALTARDLIAALRAAAHGTDASGVLGEQARWESLFAALLSLLLKKHLIADWEFVDELKDL